MKRMAQRCALTVALMLPLAASAEYDVETVAQGLEHPWSIAFLPEGGQLVTERAGRLRLIDEDGELRDAEIGGLPDIYVSGQAGLKDVVLDPEFEDNRRVFISYSCGERRANHLCLLRGTLNDDATELSDVDEIFRAEPAKTGNAHYGARIAFLPDHTLVMTVGDGFDYREQAQNPGNHLGSTVRLDRDGNAPADNPFVDVPGAKPELFTIGHRNAQAILYDPASERIYSNEHGPRGGDELNVIVGGSNYGWPLVTQGVDYTGAQITPHRELPGMEPPLVDWTPSIAPSGMTLYDGELFPDWQGDLLSGALAGKKVQRVKLEGGEVTGEESLFQDLGYRIRDVRTGPDGALYLLTDHADGKVLRITPSED